MTVASHVLKVSKLRLEFMVGICVWACVDAIADLGDSLLFLLYASHTFFCVAHLE